MICKNSKKNFFQTNLLFFLEFRGIIQLKVYFYGKIIDSDRKYYKFYDMKKYQLWLQKKSYSQHLFNLMRIKNSHHSSLEKIEHATVPVRTLTRQNSILFKYKELEEFQMLAQKLGDISYAITYKELKNRKIRIMKTFEILNQNMSMARRIKGVKSVLNSTPKDKTSSQHYYNNKRQLFKKKCELSNQEIREKNFKKFIKWENNITNGYHRYYLSLTVQNITKKFYTNHEYAAAWCEISTEKGFSRSEVVPLNDFQGKKLHFALQSELPKDCLFRMYICKGLESEKIGQIQFHRPDFGQSQIRSHRSDDAQFQVTLKLYYNKIQKKEFMLNLK